MRALPRRNAGCLRRSDPVIGVPPHHKTARHLHPLKGTPILPGSGALVLCSLQDGQLMAKCNDLGLQYHTAAQAGEEGTQQH